MPADDKRLRVLSAGLATDERNNPTGTVEIRALPLWLKGDRIVHAELTAKEARQLAIQLLTAAEKLA
jgi:hypothetical protein